MMTLITDYAGAIALILAIGSLLGLIYKLVTFYDGVVRNWKDIAMEDDDGLERGDET